MENDPYSLLKDQLLKTRPEMAPVIKLIEEQNQSGKEKSTKENELLSDNQNLVKAAKKSKVINQKLLKVIQELKEEIEYQDNIMEQLADTLGACPICFGYDSDCEECKGDGKPGTYSINYNKFKKLISTITKENIQLNKLFN